MTSRPQFRLAVASGYNRPAAAHTAKCSGGFKAKFPGHGSDQVCNLMSFEVAPHIFDRIEFRRIRGQSLDHDSLSRSSHVVFDQHAAMNRRTVPNNQDFSGNMPLEMPQELDHLGAFDAACIDLKIEPPERKATDDRKAFPVKGFMEHRSLPAQRPCARPRGAGAQSAFVDEDDSAPLLAGFFFKAGQVVRFHRRIALSSRSTARRSGRWQLNPLAPSKRQT